MARILNACCCLLVLASLMAPVRAGPPSPTGVQGLPSPVDLATGPSRPRPPERPPVPREPGTPGRAEVNSLHRFEPKATSDLKPGLYEIDQHYQAADLNNAFAGAVRVLTGVEPRYAETPRRIGAIADLEEKRAADTSGDRRKEVVSTIARDLVEVALGIKDRGPVRLEDADSKSEHRALVTLTEKARDGLPAN